MIQESLFAPEPPPDISALPAAFRRLSAIVSRHSDPRGAVVLDCVARRIAAGERHLLEIDVDPDIAALNAMRRAVEKDVYRMRAFVRFRKVADSDGARYVAWYRPEHRTLDVNGRFFVERFGSMRWAILTPDASMCWDLRQLRMGPGVPRSRAPAEDELEDLWRLYYGTVFNPARLNVAAMRAQLPVRKWVDLPEARVIPELVRQSRARVEEMIEAAPRVPDDIRQCRACGICARATGPVLGEGDPRARILLVGEQPGDEEDRAGRPFVGPAGQVLDRALRTAGLDRSALYLTNAVKAFKFEERGKRRIHQSPRASEIGACRPWLLAEIDAVGPERIVCLGASAALAVLGRKVSIAAERGRSKGRVAVTYHPSAVLRSPDPAAADAIFRAIVEDLDSVRRSVASNG